MDITNGLNDFFSRGGDTLNRALKANQLRMQISELASRRNGICAELGASLYYETSQLDEFRLGREALYEEIAQIDAQRAELERQVKELSAKPMPYAAPSAPTLVCQNCGTPMSPGSRFCTECGTPVSEPKAPEQPEIVAQASTVCPHCGSPYEAGEVFCAKCGKRLP